MFDYGLGDGQGTTFAFLSPRNLCQKVDRYFDSRCLIS